LNSWYFELAVAAANICSCVRLCSVAVFVRKRHQESDV